MNRELETLFFNYHWAQLWQKTKSCETEDDCYWQQILRDLWWLIPSAEVVSHDCIASCHNPHQLFAFACRALANGSGKVTVLALQKIAKLLPNSRMQFWLALEIEGRRRAFVHQSTLLKKCPPNEVYPFAACLQSLEQKNIETKPLLSYFEKNPPKNIIASVLLARLEAINNQQSTTKSPSTITGMLASNRAW